MKELYRRIEILTEALNKLGPSWLYWPAKKQIEGQPIAYESRTIDEIEHMVKETLKKIK